MSVLDEHAAAWHPGESAVRSMLRVPPDLNPTARGLPRRYALRAAASPLAALGALDGEGRPWCTVWGGERRFMQPVAPDVLGVAGRAVDARYDPVLRALFADAQREADGALAVKPPREGEGGDSQARRRQQQQLMAGLSIDLETRDRVKLEGRLLAGALTETSGGSDGDDRKALADVQLAMLVEGSLGNCPKYLNRRAVRLHVPNPRLVSDTLPLPPGAVDLLARADLFFLSSTDGKTMDVNHRGGGAGFVRVVRNNNNNEGGDGGGVALIYPEFSGNRLYQTLGNLHVRPQVGMVVPDFETGDALYLTGEAAILVGDRAAAYLPRAKLAVKIDVREARFVADGLSFRGGPVDFSPYSPPVWKLASEGAAGSAATAAAAGVATATLTKKEVLTPDIARFTFRLEGGSGRGSSSSSSTPSWLPGQHVTMDFSEDLDAGYSHMRDDDPQSLNDDYVRTFTVSSGSAGARAAGAGRTTAEFEITVRRHGPVTGWLFSRNPRAGLEVPVLGFGGDEAFRIPVARVAAAGAGGAGAVEHVYVAGGVGITPLLAQAPGVLAAAAAGRETTRSPLRLLWALRAGDLGLAVDTFRRIPGLAGLTTLFVTGVPAAVGEWEAGLLKTLEELGTGSIKTGRLTKEDVLEYKDGNTRQGRRKYYICAGSGLLKELVGWLEREDTVVESFAY